MKQTVYDVLNDDDEEEKYHDINEEPTEAVEIKEEPNEAFLTINSELNKTGQTIDTSLIEIKDEDDIKPDIDQLSSPKNGAAHSWYHAQDSSMKKEKLPTTIYNPLARNPLYGGGEFCAYTELCLLKNHFHPTVALYATNIIGGCTIKYSGDPLNDFTLIRFLDRFVFKNPKSTGESAGIHPTLAKRKLYKPKGVKLVPVFSAGYLKEKAENIPVDELFLHS